VSSLDSTLKEESHRWPCFLPDGRHFLYVRRGSSEKSGVYLGSLDSKDFTLVLPSTSNAVYAEPGFLLFLRGVSLMAQPFDPGKGELHDEPKSVAEDVGSDVGYSLGFFSASNNRALVISSGAGSTTRQLFWYDRDGKRLGTIGRPGIVYDFALSPEEHRVVFRRVDASAGNNHDLWVFDLVRLTESRFTFSQGLDDDPVWAPDGNSIIFDSNPDGASNIHRKISTGAEREELLLKSSVGNFPLDYSSDGRYILYTQQVDASGTANSSLWVLPLTGDRKPVRITRGETNVSTGKFSPDARWLVYASNESGREEVYVQAFPATQGKWQVSTAGGGAPQWSKDGTEIFYISPSRKLMVVGVQTIGGSVELGIPKPLFETDVDRFSAPNRYAVTRDGQRFILNLPSEGAASLPLTVVLNWTEEMEKK
jgi:dipeptidyl aminopeptidase/acylaminoacyl peptidase